MLANKFFSATVRIQEDRGHRTVSSGPYRIIRHPGYAAAIVSMLMTPLVLGSWLALVPGLRVAAGYTVRTLLEDRVLQNELEVCREYAERVRHRLVPGVW
jgi:protein-S-isoprenylcysteine O-methyltransferase Ste14